MIAAAEGVAAAMGVTRDELDDLTALRWSQYTAGSFVRKAVLVPIEIARPKGPALVLADDEGVRSKERAAIGKLAPVGPDGLHTFASQTHPADGCAGALVMGEAAARELSGGSGVARLLGFGFARVGKSRMPQAPVPAARVALDAAGRSLSALDAVTTHNPFAVNDLYLAAETGLDVEAMNTAGCSLVFGHPQGPTGLRSIAELIETLRQRGGGLGLVTGCAAGDTGAAVVVEVTD